MSITTLYRFYNTADELLYVGISEKGPERWKAHRKDKPWWTDVARTTTEHYDTRQDALDAERSAIKAEKPKHNVVHNRGHSGTTSELEPVGLAAAAAMDEIFGKPKASRLRPPDDRPADKLAGERRWRMLTPSGTVIKSHLWLTWEVAGDPISDRYAPNEISAFGLLLEWFEEMIEQQITAAPITWFIEGDVGVFEYAPGAPNNSDDDDFSTHYRYVARPRGGRGNRREQLTPGALPIADKLWEPGRGDKGGFIQSATGWKPHVYQPSVDVAFLVAEAKRQRRDEMAGVT